MYQFPTPSPSSSSPSPYPSMSIQGHVLEVTVVGCNKLKDTEWISRQDPYVCIEYGSTKNRTRTCTDGGKNPVFQEKFVFTLIEGLRELNLVVWNSNTLTFDDFIGTGKVPLQKVLSQGFDDSPWPLQTKTGRYAGEVRLILHYANHNKPATNFSPSAPPYAAQPPQQVSLYSAPARTSAPPYPPPSTAYPAPSPYPASYPPNSAAYPASPSPSPYPPNQPSAYPPNQPSAYPPNQQSIYPPSAYPPPHSVYPPPYPPPPHSSSYYPPGPFSGLYPPPPY